MDCFLLTSNVTAGDGLSERHDRDQVGASPPSCTRSASAALAEG
jgi:hypothetical protein